MAHQVRGFVGGDGCCDDGPSDTTSAAKGHLGGHVDVWDVLVLAQKRQVEKNGERGGVSGEDDQLADSAVEGLGRLVSAFFQLAVMGRLLNEVKNLLRESLVGLGPSCGLLVVSMWKCDAAVEVQVQLVK